MIKRAVVELGVTPSVEDGKPCQKVVHGEPISGENIEKAASVKLPTIPLGKVQVVKKND